MSAGQWIARHYSRLIELWAGVGRGRCAYCRRPIDRQTAVDGRFCSEQCASDTWERVNS